ncbi:ras GTPase-activating protein nGAP-like isoform X3 [Watersipora subatra]|uniref:ras GTPase-activating protein nGAP-like isoform X3 n=1 Tax=Watersipora subatra TaxID=2589382 RepID=UPI00355AF18B
MSTSSDYTPVRSLRLNQFYQRRYIPQVVYSKVATKPRLHHAESLTSENSFNSSPGSDTVEFMTHHSLARTGSSCSDYRTGGRPRYDPQAIYHPPSTTQSDYGSLQKENRDYEFTAKSRLVRTCGCSRRVACDICMSSSPARLDQLTENGMYDTLSKDYMPYSISHEQELNNNPAPVMKRLKYSGRHAGSMEHIGSETRGSSDKAGIGSRLQRTVHSFLTHTSKNSQSFVPQPHYTAQLSTDSESSVNCLSMENHYAVTPVRSVSTTSSGRSVTFSVDSYDEDKHNSEMHGSLSKRKEWNRIRNLLNVVGAVKIMRSRSDVSSAHPLIGVKLVPLPKFPRLAEADGEKCKCCLGSAMKCPASFDRKVQSARSCESLLATGARIPSVDLGEGHIQVVPLHRSMLGEDNCIQLTSSAGSSTYYSCRNSEERSQWLNHLRKTVNPGEEQMRRSDVSLKIWVQEAKNCANKKRYFCEISLDKAVYARTSTKPKADMLFWGEEFDFGNLPSIKSITISLHREADKKKKREKNTQLGYVTVPITDLQNRQIYEKWHSLSPVSLVSKSSRDSKTDLTQIRIKMRYQTVDILPLSSYNSLVKYLKANYQSLVERLEPILSVRTKDDVASNLVHVLQREQLSRRFLCDIVISEVPKHENLNLMLRGNTVATKAIEAYMKLVGNKYLHDTLEDFIRLILDSEDSCEVDPGKLQNNSMLQRNQCNLISYCEMVWGRIINSHSYFPSELRDVFTSFRRKCEEMTKSEVSDNLISACIFLRFICPAIMSPSLFGLCQELPEERQSRNFTLVAKTLQSLANFTKFGSKEDYMLFMNEFMEREWNQMQNFLKQVSSSDHSYPLTQFEGYIDVGKHLALLHSQLVENLETPESDTAGRFHDLQPILTDLTEELNSSPDDNIQRRLPKSSVSSVSSQQSTLSTPKASRPESDEYVELRQEKIPDFSNSLMDGQHSMMGSRESANGMVRQSTYPQLASSSHQRPSLTHSHQVVPQFMDKPKDPDADISNRSDSDTIRSTSSSGSRKVVRHRVWDRVLTANDLVNAKPSNLQPANKEQQPLAFINPAFKHSSSTMMTSPRRAAEHPATPEFTPLPNKFNSLNLRGRSRKAKETAAKTDLSLPSTRHYHHTLDHPVVPKHAVSASLDIPHTVEMETDSKNLVTPDSDRDEKRFGCARFPAMELYPETSLRPQPDGSNAFDPPLSRLPNEQLSQTERPSTPTSNLSWAGSQASLNTQQTGIKNIQKSIDETSKIKQEYEAEVTVLRSQLNEAQTRLNGTESRLAYQAEQTNQVMDEWKTRLDESEERLRAQQHEKDEQIKNIIQRLLAIEEDLRQEQLEMKSAISRKEQIIESQERRIRELDNANNKLQKTLHEMKEKVRRPSSSASKHSSGSSHASSDSSNRTYKTTLYVSDHTKPNSSFC